LLQGRDLAQCFVRLTSDTRFRARKSARCLESPKSPRTSPIAYVGTTSLPMVLGHDKRSAFFKLERLMPSAGQFDAVPPSDVALAIAVIARGSCGAIHTYSDAVSTARSDSRDVGPALNIALSEIIPACG
jgi:hypothetical protein